MANKLTRLHIGDVVRIFAYKGTHLNTNSCFFHGVAKDKDEPLDPAKDGVNVIGIYIGKNHGCLNLQALAQNPGFAYKCPAEMSYMDPSETTSRADITVPINLVRRYEILKPSYLSPVLPLEEKVQKTVAKR